MSYLMLFATGSMQTQNDKMLLGDMNAAKPTPDQLGQVFPLIVFVLTITFVAPYLEELVYRGIFKEILFKRTRFWLPFILSSLIFASQRWYFKLGSNSNVYNDGNDILSCLPSS